MSSEQQLIEDTQSSFVKQSFLSKNSQFRQFIFQIIGTMILVIGICCTQFTPPLTQKKINPFHNVFIPLSLYLAICFGAPFCSAHYNPSVTIGFYLRKNGSISFKKAMIYICGQFLGAIIGGIISKVIFNCGGGPYSQPQQIFTILGHATGELLGTALFVFFIFMVTTELTTFITQQSWIHIFIPLSLFCGRTYSYHIGGLNPAVLITLEIVTLIDINGSFALFGNVLLISLGSILGAALGAFFFQKVYTKSIKKWKETCL